MGNSNASRGDTGEAIDKKLDEIILKPAQWQYDDYVKAKAQLQELIREAFDAGLSKGFDTLIMDEQTAWDEWQKEGGLSSGQTDGSD